MPAANWQRERAKTRQPHLPKLVVLPETPCHVCGHARSSHSLLVLAHSCKAEGCGCRWFEPMCGCGHLLYRHVWGTAPDPWACSDCPCRRFGAKLGVPT